MPKLKDKINEVVTAFKQNNADTEKEIKKIIDEYKKNPLKFKDFKKEVMGQVVLTAVKEQTKPIMENWKKTNILFNQKAKAIILEEKENIIPKPKEKSDDYAIRISNALKYLEIEGQELKDETAFQILKDFVDDYEQMKLFKQVIKRQLKTNLLEDMEGKTIFPKTFGKFNKIEAIINTFNEMETIANILFMKGTPNSEMYIINNARIQIPTKFEYLGYEENTNDDNIVKLAEIIDKTIENMNNSVTQ